MSGTLYVNSVVSNTSITFGTIEYESINTFTTSTTSQVTVDSFSTSTYRTAKYISQMTSGTSYHVIELLIIHNGTTANLEQYGEIWTSTPLGTYDASISGGVLSLLFTPTNASTTIKLIRTAITV